MLKYVRVIVASLVIGLFSLNANAAAMQQEYGLRYWVKRTAQVTGDIIKAPFRWVSGRWDGSKKMWGNNRNMSKSQVGKRRR